jgi:hypothetical protein
MANKEKGMAHFHLPGLFEFYELYKVFLPLFFDHREYFYDWCDIGSVYGAPADCLWGGGRVGSGESDAREVFALMQEYGISSRLTFSNSLLREKHLSDKKCNELCALFGGNGRPENGIIIYSDLLLDYIQAHYPGFYFVSSTTKVLTDWQQFTAELSREEFRCVVPDFRLNTPPTGATRSGGTPTARWRSGEPGGPARTCRARGCILVKTQGPCRSIRFAVAPLS